MGEKVSALPLVKTALSRSDCSCSEIQRFWILCESELFRPFKDAMSVPRLFLYNVMEQPSPLSSDA
jgi:hypothetical protein